MSKRKNSAQLPRTGFQLRLGKERKEESVTTKKSWGKQEPLAVCALFFSAGVALKRASFCIATKSAFFGGGGGREEGGGRNVGLRSCSCPSSKTILQFFAFSARAGMPLEKSATT